MELEVFHEHAQGRLLLQNRMAHAVVISFRVVARPQIPTIPLVPQLDLFIGLEPLLPTYGMYL